MCVRYYVETEGIPHDAASDNAQHTALDWAVWASSQDGTDTQAAKRYLRVFGRKRGRDAAGVDAAQGLLPVVFPLSLAEGRAQQLYGPGAAAAASVQLHGPSAGSRSSPRNAAQVRRPEWDRDNDDKGIRKEDMREDDFNALEREIRAKVKKIVSEDSRLSEQAIEEETSMQMEGLRQWSRDLQQQDAVLRE